MSRTIYLIFAMMLVTYIPRLLPFLFLDVNRLPKKLQQFLTYIPFAALGALIVPGGITAVNNNIVISISGLLAAAITAHLTKNIVISVIASVTFTTFILYII